MLLRLGAAIILVNKNVMHKNQIFGLNLLRHLLSTYNMPNTVKGAVEKRMNTHLLALKNSQSRRERILQNKSEARY